MDNISAKLNAIDSAYLALVKHLAKAGQLNVGELSDELIRHGQGHAGSDGNYGVYLEKIGHRVKEFSND